MGPTLAKSIPKSSSLPLKYLNDKIKESLLFSPVLEDEVKNIILFLKNSATGWDGYDALIIKQLKILLYHLSHIYVICLLQLVFFHSKWK